MHTVGKKKNAKNVAVSAFANTDEGDGIVANAGGLKCVCTGADAHVWTAADHQYVHTVGSGTGAKNAAGSVSATTVWNAIFVATVVDLKFVHTDVNETNAKTVVGHRYVYISAYEVNVKTVEDHLSACTEGNAINARNVVELVFADMDGDDGIVVNAGALKCAHMAANATDGVAVIVAVFNIVSADANGVKYTAHKMTKKLIC